MKGLDELNYLYQKSRERTNNLFSNDKIDYKEKNKMVKKDREAKSIIEKELKVLEILRKSLIIKRTINCKNGVQTIEFLIDNTEEYDLLKEVLKNEN